MNELTASTTQVGVLSKYADHNIAFIFIAKETGSGPCACDSAHTWFTCK